MVKKILIIALITSMSLFANSGKIVAMKGNVIIIKGSEELKAQLGSIIEKNNEIKTANNAKLQLLFEDNTVITIGKNSHFKINDYLFEDNNVKADFGLLKGTFRTITGKIGKVAPSKFKLNSKTSSIGIRGTQILSKMAIDGDRIVCIEGEITITHLATGKIITIQAGQFVDLSADNDTLEIKILTPQDINEMDENTRFVLNDEEQLNLEDLGVVINENENDAWGEWSAEPEVVEDIINNVNNIASKVNNINDVTDPNIILALTKTATYTGKVSGTVTSSGTSYNIYDDGINKFETTVNFGTKDVSADMEVRYGEPGDPTSIVINGMTGTVKADGTGFDLVAPGGASDPGTDMQYYGTGSGKFYGQDAQSVKGSLNLTQDYLGKSVSATFEANE
jgi:hypothetical protein